MSDSENVEFNEDSVEVLEVDKHRPGISERLDYFDVLNDYLCKKIAEFFYLFYYG